MDFSLPIITLDSFLIFARFASCEFQMRSHWALEIFLKCTFIEGMIIHVGLLVGRHAEFLS